MSGSTPSDAQGGPAPRSDAAPGGALLRSARDAALAKLARARTALRQLRDREEIEWQRGYIKALEEMLAVQGLSARASRRVATSIPVEIARPGTPTRGTGTISELSTAGCRLTTALALADRDLVELSFHLPGVVQPIVASAAVVRSTRIEDLTTTVFAFRDLTLAVADALAGFLARPQPSARG